MHPSALSDASAWLLSDVAAFDAVTDRADRLVAALAARAGDGDESALARILEVQALVGDAAALDSAGIAGVAEALDSLWADLAR